MRPLLTLGGASLAALVGRAAQGPQVAVLQRAVAVIAAGATGGNQLEQVLLRHEAARKRPATLKKEKEKHNYWRFLTTGSFVL